MYEIEHLPGGVTLLLEEVPYVRSAALGIFVDCGSREESPAENGASHFLEHLVFKGTRTRSAQALAEEMDRIGGRVNAFTAKECTCFYARALSEHMEAATDVLCDMFFNPLLDTGDVQTERGVILEEIGMDEDTPEDLVTERLWRQVYQGSSLAQPILGTRSSLRRLSASRLRAFRRDHYRASGTVVSLCGRFPPALRQWLRDRFSGMADPRRPIQEPARYVPGITTLRKEIAQNHLCLCYSGLTAADPRQAQLRLLNAILGGGASSRLFQSVRERLGLCYSVYSFPQSYEDTGILGLYTAVSPATEEKALAAIQEEVERFLQDGPGEEELDRAREQGKAATLMGMEGLQARMNYMARSYQLFGRIQEMDELIQEYDAVTCEQVMELARTLLNPLGRSFSAVGDVKRPKYYQALLAK